MCSDHYFSATLTDLRGGVGGGGVLGSMRLSSGGTGEGLMCLSDVPQQRGQESGSDGSERQWSLGSLQPPGFILRRVSQFEVVLLDTRTWQALNG